MATTLSRRGEGGAGTAAALAVPDTWWRRHQMRLTPVILLLPACLFFAVFVLYPIAASVRLSLHGWDGVNPPTWAGLGNYAELLGDDVFWTAIRNNVLWLLAFMLAPIFGLALALFLNQSVPGIRLAKSLFFFPFVISQVVGLVFTWFFNAEFGLLNQILRWLGLPPVALLEDE